jgi:CRP/FNR family transcriptional regulator
MSHEIAREQDAMLLLGNMNAPQRVAAFLLNMSETHVAHGYSATRFHMRMSRADIGSFVGLTMEYVSRYLNQFARKALIHLHTRDVELIDIPQLKAIAAGSLASRRRRHV